jgi:deaminated glutathione amidase
MRKQHVMEPSDNKLRKIALHQMCSGINSNDNLKAMKRAIKAAAANGACFYFAPEMSLLLDRDRERAGAKLFTESETASIQQICRAASEAKIWVHLGSVAVRLDDRPDMLANRTLIINDQGQIRARYDKMHLFDVDLDNGESWRESSAYAPGSQPVIADTPLGPMGLTICYDMRFPDLYSTLSKAGARIFAVPAAFTRPTGQAHWHILLRARAIESAAFVIAAAQSGGHADGRETYGHSLVIDPWGEILLDMGEGEGLGFAEIDLSRVDHVRGQIPVHLNRQNIPPIIGYAGEPS